MLGLLVIVTSRHHLYVRRRRTRSVTWLEKTTVSSASSAQAMSVNMGDLAK
jgi:hypothetical protein